MLLHIQGTSFQFPFYIENTSIDSNLQDWSSFFHIVNVPVPPVGISTLDWNGTSPGIVSRATISGQRMASLCEKVPKHVFFSHPLIQDLFILNSVLHSACYLPSRFLHPRQKRRINVQRAKAQSVTKAGEWLSTDM